MDRQTHKVSYGQTEIFFTSSLFSSGYWKARKFIKRNVDKYTIKLYRINEGVGPRWILIEVHKRSEYVC